MLVIFPLGFSGNCRCGSLQYFRKSHLRPVTNYIAVTLYLIRLPNEHKLCTVPYILLKVSEISVNPN